MVFASLGPQEKDAFFSLLDEYFASRPEILTKGSDNNHNHNNYNNRDGGQAAAATAAANAVRNAVVKRPEQAAKYMSAGLKHFAGSGGNGNGKENRVGATTSTSGNSNKGTAGDTYEEEPPSMAGRIAAAQAMFSGKHNPFSKHASPPPSSSSSPPPPPAPPTSSFLKSTSSFAPPPMRRAVSNTLPPPKVPPPPPSPPPEEQGEWVEAEYDYDSGEPTDLKVKTGQRILLIERTSDDWWTGEVNGNKGLFPASYVKIL